ncbi:MAG: molybdenum cofactor guanylyltransferase [Ignavibacteriaceae bacterium]
MNSLIGVVMCGGGSTRMGKDKGLLKSDDITWAELAYEKLKSVTGEVYVSINPSQETGYREIFPGHILIPDDVTLKGPLAGLFTVHKHMTDKDIFILACDMLKMDGGTLKKISEVYESNKNLYDFFVYKKQLNIEPLAGIYTSRGITQIYNSYFAGNLQRASMKYVLENGNTYAIKIRGRNKFANFNSPSDLKN